MTPAPQPAASTPPPHLAAIRRVLLRTAGLLALAGAALYLWPGREPFLKVTPVHPDHRAAVRPVIVNESEWDHAFADIQYAIGKWREDLPPRLRDRTSAEDRSHVTSLFYSPREEPWRRLMADWTEPGVRHVQLGGLDDMMVEVYSGTPGEREGPEREAAFYKSRWTLPAAFAHPHRAAANRLFLWGALCVPLWLLAPWLAFVFGSSGARGSPIRNSQKTVLRFWVLFTPLAIFACFLPHLLESDMMKWGFAFVTISLVLLVTGIVTVVFYTRRARLLENMLCGGDLLAHWTYGPAEWNNFVEADYREERGAKKRLLLLTGVIMAVVGVGFVIFEPGAGIVVFLVLLGVFLLLALVAVLAPRLQYRRRQRQPAEALVSRDGAWLAGGFHCWNAMGARFTDAVVRVGDGVPAVLLITYIIRGENMEQEVPVRVPVPDGRLVEARQVAAALRAAWAVA
jgi:hypothetical protein